MKNQALFRRVTRVRRHASALALAAALPLLAWMLSGCMSMSGLSGSSSYACKAPDGVICDSVSGTYANAVQNKLPTQRRPAGTSTSASISASTNTSTSTTAATRAADGVAGAAAAGALGTAASRVAVSPSAAASPSAMPLRSSARILRLWFKPWEDADRDLHDQGHVYIRVDDGQWLVEHAQRQIRDAYAPLRPPPRAAGGAAEPRNASSSTLPTRPPGPLSLPGLTPPPGRPQMPVDPRGVDNND
jgi:conjugal transfer pilus assembly protein TraV